MKKLLIVYIFFLNTAFAQDSLNLFNPSLNGLIRSASVHNSKLRALEYEKLIQLSRIKQYNQQPSPSIELMDDYIPFNLKNAGELSLTYSQPLKLFGKLAANEEYYKHRAIIPEIQLNELRKDLTKAVKENYFLLYQNERKTSINNLEQEIIKGITKSLEIQYSVGKGNQTDILKSNSELQKLIYEETDLNVEKREFINNLRTLTGIELPKNYKTSNIEIYFASGSVYSDTTRLVKLAILNNPEFRMLNQDKLLNELERNIAELDRKPDITIKSGYKYVSEAKESFFLVSAMIDLPFMPWNAGRIDAVIQEKGLIDDQISSKYSSVLYYMRADIMNEVSKIEGQNEKIKFIKDITIPQLEQTLRSGLISYQTGAMDYMSVIDSYRMLRENDFKLVDEETKLLLYINELERTVSHELVKTNDN